MADKKNSLRGVFLLPISRMIEGELHLKGIPILSNHKLDISPQEKGCSPRHRQTQPHALVPACQIIFKLPEIFDGVIFIEETTRARPNPTGREPKFPY